MIRPPYELPIKRVEKDPEKLKLVYNIGRSEAEKRLPELLEFLGKK